MIGRICGTLIEKSPPYLLVDVQGVGYEVQAPMTTHFQLPEAGKTVTLFTHLSVSENAHNLFAFHSKRDRQLFRELIKVNGVGPKLAIAILSGMTADEFVQNVHEGDSQGLVKLPGVGKKTAERLIVEMKDRLKDWSGNSVASGTVASAAASGASDIEREAESALVALGYKPQDAAKAISRIRDQAESSAELIRLALKNMGK
ncbi:MAG: Holliday junction branch migration protein RuvA [Gammaproteobacteria bacterium]|nr:Holliday junction branch migration protein RuvA [Gammaproteobacteria bacterium]NVK87052.1 Holliday junction branch migration protein RuvA [Gammaproteobacteria bacterium]